MDNKKILFAGLPLSGRTTFIAALWYYIFMSHSNKRSISLNFLNGENEYLNEIANDWISFNMVSRTPISKHGKPVVVNVKNLLTNESASLEIPDFGGEIFNSHFDSREWSLEFDKLLNEIAGIILFINPNEVNNRPQLLLYETEIRRYFGEKQFSNTTEHVEWSYSFIPHQVKLVETLQFIEFYKLKGKSIKISLVISAWDTVISKNESTLSPTQWLADNLPLLFQYLICNENIYKAKYFGVSAQGGDYSNKEELTELTKKEPENRILVKEEEDLSNDIAKPILWVLE